MVGLAFHRRNRLLAKELREVNTNTIKNTNTNSTSSSVPTIAGLSTESASASSSSLSPSVKTTFSDSMTIDRKKQKEQSWKGGTSTSSGGTRSSLSKKSLLRSFLERKGFTIAILVVLFSIKQNWDYVKLFLLPNGVAHSTPLQYTFMMNSPPNNTALQFQHGRTYVIHENLNSDNNNNNNHKDESLLYGPETILWDEIHDKLYIANAFGQLVSVSNLKYPSSIDENDTNEGRYVVKSDTRIVKDLGNGRPLGGQFTKERDGTTTLYIADAVLGLLRIRNFYHNDPSKNPVEIVAAKVYDHDTKTITPIHFADDVAIGPVTGKVYFTDATNIPPRKVVRQRRSHDGTTGTKKTQYEWDLLYPSIQECLRGGNATGRLLQYDPTTNEVTILDNNLAFANGLTVLDKDESALLVVETCRMRVQKYYLKGPKAGTIETVIHMNQLPAFLDGIDCSFDTNLCYGALMNEVSPIQKLQKLLPHSIEPYARTFSLWLARFIDIPISPYGGIIIIDPTTAPSFTIQQFIIDPTGHDISGVTGVTYYKKKLYLGSLHNHYIGIYDLDTK